MVVYHMQWTVSLWCTQPSACLSSHSCCSFTVSSYCISSYRCLGQFLQLMFSNTCILEPSLVVNPYFFISVCCNILVHSLCNNKHYYLWYPLQERETDNSNSNSNSNRSSHYRWWWFNERMFAGPSTFAARRVNDFLNTNYRQLLRSRSYWWAI